MARSLIGRRNQSESRAPVVLSVLFLLAAAGNTWAGAPVVDRFQAIPAVVTPGGTVTLEVEAHDPDCASECLSGCGLYVRSDLTVWSADGGAFASEHNGSAGSPYAATAQWRAPSVEGSYIITVSLADSGGMLCGGRQSVSANLGVQVTSTPNGAPIIDSLYAQPVALFPGESSQLTCMATDPDDDPVLFSWSTDLGVIIPGVNGSATFESEAPGLANVTCTATDPSGAASAESVVLTISDVEAERMIRPGVASPHRLDVDSKGVLYVVDRRSGGITAIRLETGDLMYRIPIRDASTVAADWQDRLLVGTSSGAGVFDRAGNPVLDLATGLGEVSDVAVDRTNRRFVSLYRKAGRVVVHDENGAIITAFGTTGDGPAQLLGPSGVGVAPTGHIFVADTGHGQIKEFDLDGDLVRTIGQAGGAVGEFVELDDVAVDENGLIYASDSFQDWLQTFLPDGTLREVIGSYGEGLGEFKTAAGLAPIGHFGKLVVASVNTPGIQVFQLGSPTPVDWPTPQIELSSNSLTFSDQEVGTVGGPLEVIVTNNGTAPLGIHDLAVAGPFAAETTCLVIDPGHWCSVPLVFAPIVPGQNLGSLSFQSNAGTGQHTVSLTGTAFVPANLMLSETVVEFSQQGIGTTSMARRVTLSNIGSVPLAISGIGATAPFELGSTCSSNLKGGASCALEIEFAPDTIGPAIGAVTIESSAAGSPSRIDLSGEGILLELTPNPVALDFGPVAAGTVSRTEQIEVLNTGSGRIQVGAVDLFGDAADFHLTTDYCSNNRVDVGQSCWIEVSYSPGAADQSDAQLVIPIEAGLEFSVSLGGRLAPLFADGFESGDTIAWVTPAAKGLQVEPGAVSFNQVDLGTDAGSRVVTIQNHSQTAAYLGALWIQGDSAIQFAVHYDACSSKWLEPGQSCTIGLTMLTLEEGHFSAVLVIPASVADEMHPAPVLLTGTVRWP